MGIQLTKLKSANYIIGSLFIFLSTIPWFGLPFLDSQPWPILSAVLFLMINVISSIGTFKIPKWIILLAGFITFGIILGSFVAVDSSFIFYRGIINYFSLVIYFTAFYHYLKRYGFPLSIFMASNIIWLLVGIVQLFSPEFLSSFVANRTTLNRGVTSLAPEPTFFAIYLFFSTWLCLIGAKYKPALGLKILLFINVLAILVLAKSSMVVLFLGVVVIFLIIHKMSLNLKSLSFIFALILVVLIGYFSIINFMPNTRLGSLVKLLVTVDPVELVKLDVSINERFASIVIPIQGFFYNFGLPGGFVSFESVAPDIIRSYGDYFESANLELKIMSWNGAVFYELGFVGIIIWIMLFKKLLNATKLRRHELSVLFIILFAAIPLAFPLIPMIFAVFYYSDKYALKKIFLKNENLSYHSLL